MTKEEIKFIDETKKTTIHIINETNDIGKLNRIYKIVEKIFKEK